MAAGHIDPNVFRGGFEPHYPLSYIRLASQECVKKVSIIGLWYREQNQVAAFCRKLMPNFIS